MRRHFLALLFGALALVLSIGVFALVGSVGTGSNILIAGFVVNGAASRRMLIRGMSLRLKLNGLKAEGMRVGYVDVEQLWQSYAHTAKWGGKI